MKKGFATNQAKPLSPYGAEEGTRTPTGIRQLDPEPSASTSSATSARNGVDIFYTSIYITTDFLSIGEWALAGLLEYWNKRRRIQEPGDYPENTERNSSGRHGGT